ncbi:NAD(P)-dependent oxidoreductase [Rhodococcus sp. NPDC058514]|uniref:NAD(P)-dependent oxidoreductase n=1 Tax=unclassified Rhodococcus (in: high G+C Gram-positive bacteria) TaxID=192944 RepID=UPI00364EC848
MNHSANTPVTVIGLGPMGRAMVGAFLDGGHQVTVWNRTASRADELVSRGAKRAETPTEAVLASDLVILSLTHYGAMYDVLDTVGDALAGRVVVNLSSDTPEATREASRWLADRGADLLVGGVMVPAPMVGGDGAYVFYSGAESTMDAHRQSLSAIGRPDYRGEDPALAQLWYQAQLDVFLTALSSFAHAAALVGSAGVSATEFFPYAAETFTLAVSMLEESAERFDAGDHRDEGANVTMMGATADHIVGASRDAGIDVELPQAIQAHYARAIADGHGRDSWTSLFETIRKPRPANR